MINAHGDPILNWGRAVPSMTEDSDAESIRRERERRRAEERSGIDRDRRERELELARLRRAELLQTIEERKTEPTATEGTSPKVDSKRALVESPPSEETVQSSSGRIELAPRVAAGPPKSGETRGASPTDRPIGRSIHTPALRQLLALNPTERFDIQLLNSLTFPGLVDEAARDPQILEPLRRRAESLMVRVKAEVDDPLNAGAFLREQVLLWYQKSGDDPEWSARMPERWAGLFADSRVTGGKLHRWLNARLLSVYEEALHAGRLGARIRRGLRAPKAVEAAVSRTPHQQIQAEAAQALLDDLAARPRSGDGPYPLVRLSELAVRRQVATLNEALALLFSSHETGPFIVLHPNRYPDCDEVQIRPPAGGASGAALAFLLVSSRSARRGGARSGSPAAPRAGGGEEAASGGGELEEEAYDGTTIWESTSARASTWKQLVEEHRRERKHLGAPPKDYRVRPSYAALRDALLEDEELRKAFMVARWRGRPAGLPLLVTLLQKGVLAPEVGTDHEYLEAELGSLVADDPEWKPPNGTWTFHNWTVVREESPAEGRKYRAERAPAPA